MIRAGLILFAALAAPLAGAGQAVWTGSWAAAPVAAAEKTTVEFSQGTTFRDVVHLSLGGKALRLKISNEFGTAPLFIARVHVALSAGRGTSGIAAGSDRAVRFGGREAVEVPPGSLIVSDPVALPVAAMADVAVSLFVPPHPAESPLTMHALGTSTNFVTAGDKTSAASLEAAKTVDSWFLLKGVDVDAGPRAVAVVTLGASITDGAHSTPNRNNRWPDVLARRLAGNAATKHVGVLNAGISGNRMLHNQTGPSALARLDRDVLAQSGAKYVLLALGTNDIGRTFFPKRSGETVTAEQLIWSYQQVALRAHARGIKVIVGTLNPFDGADYYSEAGEAMRQAVNAFVRSSKDFDGVADFDKATRDPAQATRILPAYDSGDHLHLNDIGYKAMADCIDLRVFER